MIVLIATFQYFTQAYTLTNGRGDPNNATLFINLELFREAFVFSRMGYGAAIAWLLFAIVLVLTAALFWFAASASTTPAASGDARRADQRRALVLGDRGPVARSTAGSSAKASLTMFAVILISAYLMPLLYMVTTSFQQPSQIATPGAPIWPATPDTGTFEGKEYPIYTVPIDGGRAT